MNQKNIGKLIATLRKEKQMTQMELANKLGVTDRAVSKWENGRGMPDLSLLEPLCNELDISVNELLSGKKADSEEKKCGEKECDDGGGMGISEQALMGFRSQLKQEEQKKAKRKIASWIFGAGATLAILGIIVALLCNKTFFRETYEADFLSDVHISIPRFCYYRITGGLDEYTTTLKTLLERDEVDVFIDEYLHSLEKREAGDRAYHYDSGQDMSIINYRINNDGVGPINTIYITYRKGKLAD